MRRFERELSATVQEALSDWQEALFEGIDEGNVMTVVMRLNQESVTIPLRDALIGGLQMIAIAGAEFGREQVERQVFGVKDG